MIACPPWKGATAISPAPTSAMTSAAQPSTGARASVDRLQIIAPHAANQTSTEKSTCATIARWKKPCSGNSASRPGVRERTISTT
jgi:hypothetical protein